MKKVLTMCCVQAGFAPPHARASRLSLPRPRRDSHVRHVTITPYQATSKGPCCPWRAARQVLPIKRSHRLVLGQYRPLFFATRSSSSRIGPKGNDMHLLRTLANLVRPCIAALMVSACSPEPGSSSAPPPGNSAESDAASPPAPEPSASATASASGTTAPAPPPPTCSPGRADCDAQSLNGCEVDTDNDPRNCGACGTSCLAGEKCVSGRCTQDCGALTLC